MEGRYSEVEKVILRSVFKQMLEEGLEYGTAETIELFNLEEGVPIPQRKRFLIAIKEDPTYGRNFKVEDQAY